MVWVLLLCHFTADYPLQTDAMVIAKKHIWGLITHVMIHFVTMLFIMVGLLQMNLVLVLPVILTLTAFHFAIDTWKNILSKRRPSWVVFIYLQDQVLHIASIIGLVFLFRADSDILINTLELFWIMPVLSMLLATQVWFISERVLAYSNPSYQRWGTEQCWSRMISRALLLSSSFLGWSIWALLLFCFGLIYHWQDLAGKFHLRALLIDVSVVLCIVVGLNIF